MRGMPIVDELIRRELAPGERVVWAGQPHPRAIFWDQSFPMAFALLWSALPIAYMASETQPIAPWHFAFLIGLVGVGAYWFLKAVSDCFTGREARYAITDRRLIVAHRDEGKPVVSLRLEAVAGVERRGRGREHGTLKVPIKLVSDGDGGREIEYLKLLGVRDPDAAYRLLAAA